MNEAEFEAYMKLFHEEWNKNELPDEVRIAFEAGNREQMAKWLEFGKSSSRMAKNIIHFNAGTKFGYLDYEIKPSGWLRERWEHTEVIDFKVGRETVMNSVYLAKGRNGKWTFSFDYAYGKGEGGGSMPSYFGESLSTREEALEKGISELKITLHNRLDQVSREQDSANVIPSFIRKVLSLIEEYHSANLAEQSQLDLFF